MKTCNTCKHRSNNLFFAIVDSSLLKCLRPSRGIDTVTGKHKPTYASVERMFDTGCGYEGRFHSDNEADATAIHSYKVPTDAELWALATKAVEKHGFGSVREAIDYAIRAKEAGK